MKLAVMVGTTANRQTFICKLSFIKIFTVLGMTVKEPYRPIIV